MKTRLLLASVVLLSGCFTAAHVGKTGSRGLETACGASCLEYKSDGTGCAKFQEGTSQSCTAYFEKVCKIEPTQCKRGP